MSKRGLYPSISKKNTKSIKIVKNYMNFLQYADGKNDLENISKIIKLKKGAVLNIYKLLKKKGIIL